MAKYKAYPEYKDSGVEWVDSIPSYWDVKPTFALCDASTQKNIDGAESNVLSLSYGNIIPRDVETNFGLLPESFNTYQIISCGDVILRLTDLQNDKNSLRVGLAKQKGIITSAYLKLKANSDINPKFLYRLLHSYDTTKVFYGMGGGLRQSMKFEDFRRLPLLLPPYEEQVKISVFLDHETAKIDNLIEKQQQLIELLKEKRQAVISHAVTKGLNPDVPMKDSGVEWLGEVPEHWIIAQLKFNTLEMQTGPFGSQLHAEDYVIDGIPLINPAHMNAGMIIPDPKVTVDEATQERLGRHKLSEGEIIFSRRGELGRCAVVKKNNEGWLCGTGSLKAKLTKKIIPDYAYTLISSEGVVSELTLESKGSTMANLNTETFGRIRLPVPPISEQEAILDYIKIISDKYDYLIRSADTAIRLMQERRTALISAAVTGKIDVRDWDAPDTQDIEESQEAIA
ncbi:restriction modification system DNA specificity domain-containing protein [Enterobacter hormaechei]|uniref:restriction endonuclease subunit S n=1 Tax=Enterobacter hormaechei TaxID=158836 RepID=UPI00079A9F80|nr:restriction endonuclease subunit S [Enterobacter hormaechei]SAF66014.1 restriction modification system DNA specificity domain-containing protein [Enterobacter hormaechei]